MAVKWYSVGYRVVIPMRVCLQRITSARASCYCCQDVHLFSFVQYVSYCHGCRFVLFPGLSITRFIHKLI